MPYTMEDFRKDAQKEFLSRLTLEQRLARLTPAQVASALTPEQRVIGLTPAQLRQLAKEMEKQSEKL